MQNQIDHLTAQFLENARTVADVIGLAPGAEVTAANVVVNSLGADWLSSRVRRLGKSPNPFPAKWKHPLAECWIGPSGSDVCEVLELTAYLTRLANVDGIQDVLPILRHDYVTATLQLSHAYRLVRAGATNAQLEPPSAEGRADIFASFGGAALMVECYAPALEFDHTGTENLYMAIERIFGLFRERVVRITIRPKVRIDARVRKQMLGDIAALSDKGCPASMETDRAFYDVSGKKRQGADDGEGVRDEIATSHSGAAWVIRQFVTSAENWRRLKRGEPCERQQGSELAVFPAPMPPVSIEKKAEQLAKKIARKAGQARGTTKCERLVIVRTNLATSDHPLESAFAQSLLDGVDKHLRDSCHVLLVNKKWSPNDRWHWYGQLVSFKSGSSQLTALIEQLRDDELHRDLLLDEGLGAPGWPLLGSLPHYQ